MNKFLTCTHCEQTFSCMDSLKRHIKSKHNSAPPLEYLRTLNTNQKSNSSQNGREERVECEPFNLLHPFTALVAGMTGSGKTVWVQYLLEHATEMITPPSQRIIWCYSQW